MPTIKINPEIGAFMTRVNNALNSNLPLLTPPADFRSFEKQAQLEQELKLHPLRSIHLPLEKPDESKQ